MLGENNSITTYRHTSSGGKDTYSASATLTAVPAYVERLGEDRASMFDQIASYDVYRCFLEGSPDIDVGDKVVDASSRTYVVYEVKPYEGNTDAPDSTQVIMYKKHPPS